MALFAYSSPVPSPAILDDNRIINPGDATPALVISPGDSTLHSHSTSPTGNVIVEILAGRDPIEE